MTIYIYIYRERERERDIYMYTIRNIIQNLLFQISKSATVLHVETEEHVRTLLTVTSATA